MRHSPGLRWAAALCNADWHIGAPLLVALATTWHTDIASVATGIAAHSLGQGLALPLWGWLTDRIGPARSLRAGLLIAAVASAGLAFCPDVAYWIALRTAAGVGFAAVAPSVSLYYDRLHSPQARQSAFAGLTTVTAASAIAAPVIAGTAVQIGSWRPAFALLALLTAATALRIRPSSARERDITVLAASKRPSGLRPHAPMGTAYVTVIGLGAAEGAVMLALPALISPALAAAGTPQAASPALTVYAVGVLLGTLALRRHAPRWGPRRLLATGGSLAGTGALLAAATPSVAFVLLCAALLGVAWSYLHTTLQTWLPRLVPDRERARAASLFSASGMLAGSAVVATTTTLLQDGHRTLVFASGAALCALLTAWTTTAARRWG
ncbi:MFS transporter [Streptomyces sp. NPDC047525]|uniref:MFS transporter n=1 Tax=Streptomyces sp. NPDC047525 TaxID=3155264 RepID=UPI0034001BDA